MADHIGDVCITRYHSLSVILPLLWSPTPHHRTIDDSQLSSNCQISICFRIFLIVLNNQLIRWVKMIFFLLSSFDLFWSLFMTLPSWFSLFWRLMVLINIYSPPSPLHLSSRRHRNDKLIAATSRCWPELAGSLPVLPHCFVTTKSGSRRKTW